ncbi:MAG: arginine--tRNA ligase [Gammaproteobacteria bacterium]|nr:arginine--tRNA ligase [Gammaproteobacteria bacterium]
MNLRLELSKRFQHTLQLLGFENANALVFRASRPEFGDYQVNGVISAAKSTGMNPRSLAQTVSTHSSLNSLPAKLEIAGPGFINVTLDRQYVEDLVEQRPAIAPTARPERIVIDYSSPNIAKELHVGHLRSTVIGDAVARMLRLHGHDVIPQNHVGDWGTAFGKLIAHLDSLSESETQSLSDIERLYVDASSRFDSDFEFANQARSAVTNLQAQRPAEMEVWRRIVAKTINHMQGIYGDLDVLLQREDIRGESAYNAELPAVIDDLNAANLLSESEGAKCVYVDGFFKKDDSPLPMIVQKSDGGYLYHTTDLAAVKHRVNQLRANRLMYLTDARQIHHFKHLFAVARAVKYAQDSVVLEHLVFGSILNADGAPLKSRTGSSILLSSLIEEGIERARQVIQDRESSNREVDPQEIARRIAISSIKYADLSKNRINDYRFDWDTMLAFEGNTAPYLLYAYARVCSLFERGKVSETQCRHNSIKLTENAERDLALAILQFQELFEQSTEERKPHHLCTYLYELTVRFMRFYEQCPILKGTSTVQQESRLGLCTKVAEILRTGLQSLGISVLDRM